MPALKSARVLDKGLVGALSDSQKSLVQNISRNMNTAINTAVFMTVIEVGNEGQGLYQSQLDRVFDKFVKFNQETQSSRSTGLGFLLPEKSSANTAAPFGPNLNREAGLSLS